MSDSKQLEETAKELANAVRAIERMEARFRAGKTSRAPQFEAMWSRLVAARKRVEALLVEIA